MGRCHLEAYGSHDIIVQDDMINAMPWKGKVLWSDFNSGLWGAKLAPKNTVVP